jgi:hypothetical protein
MSPYKCPKCSNDNPGMIETSDHRREQVYCFCDVCSHGWIHIFNVHRENIIPEEIKK